MIKISKICFQQNPGKGTEFLQKNSEFLNPISLQSDVVDLRYFKLLILLDQII